MDRAPHELSEEHLRAELAYFKARLTDIDKAPPGSRHREGRARILRQIREYERLLSNSGGKADSGPTQPPSLRPRMMSH